MTHRIYKNEHCELVLNYVRRNYKTSETEKTLTIEEITMEDADRIQSTMFRNEEEACGILNILTPYEEDRRAANEISTVLYRAKDDMINIILKRIDAAQPWTSMTDELRKQVLEVSKAIDAFRSIMK